MTVKQVEECGKPQKMKRPLSNTNMTQDLAYLRNLIVHTAHGKGLIGNRIKKFPEWEPVWWPSELWPWNMVTNFDKVSSKKWIENKLPDSPAVVIKKAVRCGLERYNLPPETHVEPAWFENKEAIKRVNRKKGIRDDGVTITQTREHIPVSAKVGRRQYDRTDDLEDVESDNTLHLSEDEYETRSSDDNDYPLSARPPPQFPSLYPMLHGLFQLSASTNKNRG